MPRTMLPEREKEFAELHAFVDFYATHVELIDPSHPSHPTVVGVDIVREYGRSRALEGLRQAVHDIVEEAADLTPAEVTRLDTVFAEAGRMSVSEARRRYASMYKRVLKRGSIRSETEFYLATGVLADMTSSATAEERRSLEKMVAAFGSGVRPT